MVKNMKKIKKIVCLLSALAMLPASAFAEYSQSDYRKKADEIAQLIQQCKEKGINVQYEEIDSNILNVYSDRIQNEFIGKLDTSITDFQAGELDSLYNSAKENLEGYLNGTKLQIRKYTNTKAETS